MARQAPQSPRRRPRDRRRAIISAAERLFARRGYARTSMKQLAAAVGVSDAALYNHFASKRDILDALYEERGFYHAMEILEHLSGSRRIEDQLVLTTLASADLWAQNADFLRIVIGEVLAGDSVARETHGRIMERWHAGMRRLFVLYASQGALEPGAAGQAGALVHLLFGSMVAKLLSEPAGTGALPFSQPEFRQKLCDDVRWFIRSLVSGADGTAPVSPAPSMTGPPATTRSNEA